MKRYRFFLVFVLFIGLFFSGNSLAASFRVSGLQPLAPNSVFSIFSANTPEEGTAAAALAVEKTGKPDFYRFGAHLSYGVAKNFEVSLNIPYVHQWQNDLSGMEDIAMGLKHRFFSEGKYGPSVSYLVTASLVPGKEELSTDGHIGGGIVVSKRVGPVSGSANLIYAKPVDSDLEDEVTFGAGFDFAAAHNFKFLTELYGKKSYYSSHVDQMELKFGARLITRENLFTTVGAGFDFKEDNPDYRLMLSLTLVFPKEKRVIKKVYEEAE